MDLFQNRFCILQNFMISETNYPQTLTPKERISQGVFSFYFPVKMLSTIQFNDQGGFPTVKIHDVSADDPLTVKANSGHLFTAKF